jgi:hypothetical protein
VDNKLAPPINIMSEFFTPNNSSYDFYAGEGINNYLMNEKLHKYEDEKGFIAESHTKGFFNDYMQRKGIFKDKDFQPHLMLFNKNGRDVSDPLEREKVHPKSNVWSVVISLREDVCFNNDISSLSHLFTNVLFKEIGIEMKKYGFKPEHFDYSAVVHKNTENHHIHLKMFQPASTPDENIVVRGKIPEIAFAATKVMLSKELLGFDSDSTKMDASTVKYRSM